jgi:hypothetical protein
MKGLQEPATMAHIVAGNSAVDYSAFGPPTYKDKLDVKSHRNFIPLCGTKGLAQSCHNEFDTFLLAFLYSPFEGAYKVISLNPQWRHFDLNGSNISLSHNPYRRLLSWRCRKSLLEHGHRVSKDNVMDTVMLANLSEESRSIMQVEVKNH